MRATINNAATATKPKAARFGLIRGRLTAQKLWRRGWDSNPRTPVKMLLEFQSSAFDRSATSPINYLRRFSRKLPAPSGRLHRLARARIIHRHACGGACFGTLNGGGASRHGSVFFRGGGAGVFKAGMCKALAVSGASSPGGIFRGAMLADRI